MRSVEITAKTTDEAIALAIMELGISADNEKSVEILVQPNKGIFGFGAKEAKVRVSVEDNPQDIAINFLQNIFKQFNLDVEIKVKENKDFIVLDLIGNGLGILIGRRGETLDAFQYLTNLAVSKVFCDKQKFILDVEGYRKKREETLEKLARKLAAKVKDSNRNISLEPMSPYERRVIHTVLQEDPQIRTFSEGDEPYRKVVITKKR